MKNIQNATLQRPIDNLGRVVIPKEIRKSLELHRGSRLSIHTYGTSIILSVESEESKSKLLQSAEVLPAPLMEEISNAVAQLNPEDVLAWVDILRRMARVAS